MDTPAIKLSLLVCQTQNSPTDGHVHLAQRWDSAWQLDESPNVKLHRLTSTGFNMADSDALSFQPSDVAKAPMNVMALVTKILEIQQQRLLVLAQL
mmetsp:Transcript_147513/g.473887  ORF Transcript_147513/g.473887 Transcript_147513/m.473887 type:complete len:96 (+) Transcript_147513:364-651(+)|eukprot:CAMPEP_0203953316 /NCGR_PEP_ID=MMETSP0359-20131031/86709_1 /ASSEMBLY_ACC=CAM_ASM_000338 /TAXON_ID=268821 /ORGANISM="Scrippsiella Hangoei, Strain SHTV-5" /LENGTH=95 /DNA_ID=CAMNT_0050886575 /DNA_START=311 /DNA_END=598 /DNA_ORIENTATION=+